MSARELLQDLLDGNFSHAGERMEDFVRSSIMSLLEAIDASGGETLWSIAKTAVEAEMGQDKTNEEKHASAREAIIEALAQAGHDAIKWAVDTVIKMIVAKLKKVMA